MKLSAAGKRAVILLCALGFFGSAVLKKSQDQNGGQADSFRGYVQTDISGEAGASSEVGSLAEDPAGIRAADPRININMAGRDALKTLPGIGDVKAQAIIDYRKEHGPFSTPDKLMRVYGIGEKTYERLKDLIRV